MATTKTKRFPLFALMLVIGAFLMLGTTTAYASDGAPTETLTVDEVWLTGDTLHIAVTDATTNENQTLELNLSDYAKSGDEYVTIQATDSEGRTSNSIQFKNPYYVASAEGDFANAKDPSDTTAPDESSVSSGANPFTPNGTGTVLDNATDGDGKEFFTVETEDGSVFYLIIDRQRSADNVYLLGAVTDEDLMPLAKPSDDGVSAIETPPTPEPPDIADPEPEPEPEPPVKDSSTGTIIFAVAVIAVVGGAGYYFKILRPKQQGSRLADDYDDESEDYDEDEEYDTSEDGEEDEGV